jgi:hypothetical protein
MHQMSEKAEPAGQVQSWDTNTMPWEIRHIDELDGDLAAKQPVTDPDTGMSVIKMKYFAGFTHEWRTHYCAHGMYVVDGILKTHAGSFGPGSFVWFSEGDEDGARRDPGQRRNLLVHCKQAARHPIHQRQPVQAGLDRRPGRAGP